MVSDWIAGFEGREPGVWAAWLSLDEADGDPTRFLTYLVAALQTLAPETGAELLSMLQSPQPPPTESLLTALLNALNTLPNHFVLVLDDYHVASTQPVDQALTFLLKHLPPRMHLVITTREDPPLPLARLRAKGQLMELRAADLRFTPSEAAEYLRAGMGLHLSTADLAALQDRTEGWIAGLQLAALSMRGQQDIPGFVRAFAGDHRYIVDYLVEEVLQHQPEPARRFLLQTSVLDRLNGSLCEAVTGQEEGAARLEALERANLFVVPLDDRRQWYRYHHLFGQVLHAHLMAEQPGQVSTLHQRASVWHEQNGFAAEAIHHALASQDLHRAADLIERAIPDLRRSRQEAAVLGWLMALPDESIRCRPVLGVHYAGALLVSGRLEGVQDRLQEAERWLDPTVDRSKMVVADQEEFRRLPASIAIYRAACAQAVGDVTNTMKYARRVQDLVPDEEHLLRGSAAGFLGLAYWTRGDLAAAQRAYAECMARVQKAGHLSDALGCALALADIRIGQGHLGEAMSTYEQGLRLATEPGAPALRGAADMYVGMSQLCRERNDLNSAAEHLLKSRELGEHMGLPQNRYRWRVAMAGIRQAQGDLSGALDLLQEAERLYAGDFFPNVRPIAALKARVWVAQGQFDQALNWVRARGLSSEDDLSYLQEFEHITLARVLLAGYQSDRADRSLLEAMRFLERLLTAAQKGERLGSAIEILMLQARAHQMQGDIPAALARLERALTLAEPEGYIRTFVDEGPLLRVLLEKAAKHGIAANYAHQLLAASGEAEDRTPVKQALIEPLSERELQVLRLLGTDLNGPEMARQLMVSLNTLRTHTKNIYTKLAVTSRRAAVRRADELNLL